jgi:hypothetical protein
MRRMLITLGVLLALAASPAGASPGRTETGHFALEDQLVVEPDSALCGFPITLAVVGEGVFEAFYAANGELQRVHVLEHTLGTISANGISLRDFSNDNKFYDLRTLKAREIGVVFRDSLRGTGVVITDRGRLIWNFDPETGEFVGPPLFEAGPHPELNGEVGALCAALTPQ